MAAKKSKAQARPTKATKTAKDPKLEKVRAQALAFANARKFSEKGATGLLLDEELTATLAEVVVGDSSRGLSGRIGGSLARLGVASGSGC